MPINEWGIPIVQNYQIPLYVVVVILVQLNLGLSKKAGELLELCGCFFSFTYHGASVEKEDLPVERTGALETEDFL